MKMTLPQTSEERKKVPVFTGYMAYFPAAIAGAAKVSMLGMQQHKLAKLGHDRSKSADHSDCVPRHMFDAHDLIAAYERGEPVDPQRILFEASQAMWRVSAWSQELHERFGNAPMAPAAFMPPQVPPPPPEPTHEIPAFLRPQKQI
jgi:hypothetical protein